MAIEIFNRYEKKYLLNEYQYNEIRQILSIYMNKDKFNEDDKKYLISNIYYDTDNDYLIRQSLQKPKYKEKIRLRSYGPKTDGEFVFLEIKKKHNGLVNKRRTKLTLREAKDLIEYGKIEIKDYMNVQVVNEIKYFLSIYDVVPKVYLSYERLAYFAKNDNDLRITIDTNIKTDRKNLSLNRLNIGDKLLDDGNYLMEIKSSKSMPMWLVNALSAYEIYPTSFSKYGTEYKNYLQAKEQTNFLQSFSFVKEYKGEIYGYSY